MSQHENPTDADIPSEIPLNTRAVNVLEWLVIGFAEQRGLQYRRGNYTEKRIADKEYMAEVRAYYHREARFHRVPEYSELARAAQEIAQSTDPGEMTNNIANYIAGYIARK